MLSKQARQFAWKAIEVMLQLHKSWSVGHIAKELKAGDYEELSAASISSLKMLVSRCARRFRDHGAVIRKHGSGRPRSAQTNRNMEQVIGFCQNNKGRSARNAAVQFNLSKNSASRILKNAGLKPYHTRKTSKITERHVVNRVRFARYMLRHFGKNPFTNGEKWTRLVTSDFSKTFRLTPLPNTKNEIIWAATRDEADQNGGLAGVEKFSPGTMLWGAVSYRGLIPRDAPVFVDEFLKENFQFNNGEKKTMTGPKYAVLLKKIAAVEVKRLFPMGDAIFQDDGATIHRTPQCIAVAAECFNERVPVEDQCAKFDDVWCVENLWGIIKEKIGGKQFENLNMLKDEIRMIWQGISHSRRTCKKLISSMPKRCRAVIKKEGRRLTRRDYLKE